MKYNILLISKETSIKSRIFTLTENFANVYWTKSMQDGLFHLTMFSYELIIVDMIQDMKFTYGVIKTIRKFKKLLILVLASGETEEKILCIEAGADVAMTKSSADEDLQAQIYALVRRQREWEEDKEPVQNIQESGLTMNYMFRKAFWKEKELKLSRHEYDFLYLLASTPGRVYTFEQIYQVVWGGYPHGNIDNVLWCLIKRIRKKLNELEPNAGNIIQSVPKTGYCFRLNQNNTD